MKLVCLFSFLLGWFLTSPALAQASSTLTGTVTTTAGQPVPFATVAVLNSTLGATADQGGNFSIAHVPAGRQTVAVSSVGYATRTHTVMVGTGPSVPLNFQLPGQHGRAGRGSGVSSKGRNHFAANPHGRVGAGHQATARVPGVGF